VKSHDACLFKRAYETEAEAQEKGSEVYFCIYCCKFHRRTSIDSKQGEARFAHDANFMRVAMKRLKAARWAA
jgi:hypothetical protein